jgi:preprotein translocase subunit YajC
MNNLISILLQAQQGGGMMQMVFLLAIVVVFYFFMIRPQVKKQKAEKEFRTKLEKGAKVVTIGGIYGKIVDVSDRTFMLEIADNVKVKIEKSAISAEATKAIEQNVPAKV